MTKECHMLCKFDPGGIRKASSYSPSELTPRGELQVLVTFDENADGICVSAEEQGASYKESITITNDKGRLSQEEIERMVREAEEMKDEDDKLRKKVEAKNNLEHAIFNAKSTLEKKEKICDKLSEEDIESLESVQRKICDKLSEEDIESLESAAKEAQEWIDSEQDETEADDVEGRLKHLKDLLDPILQKVGGTGAGGAGGADGPQGVPGDDEDVDDLHDEL